MRGYNAPMTNIRDYILDGTPEEVFARLADALRDLFGTLEGGEA